MKDLLSKERCCYKVHTFLRSSAYPCSIDNPFYVLPHPHPHPPPPFLQGNLDAPLL